MEKSNRNNKRRRGTTTTTTLCDLPDDVLGRIVSLLPTPDAARTSMASKGLASSFCSIPKLEFNYVYFLKKARLGGRRFESRRYMDMVERSLHARDKGSSIREFSLSCVLADCSDVSRVGEWISDIVLKHNVQDLRLLLLASPRAIFDIYPVPSCVFQSEKLRKLHLRGCAEPLPIPPRVYLPNLKDLALRSVGLVDGELTGKLLSSCPSLEKLSIQDCRFFEPITVSAPMLDTISVSASVSFEEDMCPDLAIHAPNLKHIFYKGGLQKRLVISGSPLLDEVDIRLRAVKNDVSNNMRRLLQDISRVKNRLTLSSDVLQQLNGKNDPFPDFSNLRNLNLTSEDIYVEERPLVFLDSGPLCSLLGRCPSIETLEIYMDVGLNAEPPERHQHPFPSTLKKVTINHLFGSHRQLLALGFLLTRAPVLEELVLQYGIFRGLLQPKLLDEHYFSTLPRISEPCIVRVIPPPNSIDSF